MSEVEASTGDGGRPGTWHHGLVARWWALFNVEGPEIECFGRYVAAGQPALDVACGTGRPLVPWVAAGLDLDGVDVSADMIAYCRERAEAAGPTCGPGDARARPAPALPHGRAVRRVRPRHDTGRGRRGPATHPRAPRARRSARPARRDVGIRAGALGALARWRDGAAGVPVAVPGPEARRRGPDGVDDALSHRFVAVDSAVRRGVREIHAWRGHADELVAEERHELTFTSSRPAGLVARLGAAGFADVRVPGGYDGGPPTPDHCFLVYEATKPP